MTTTPAIAATAAPTPIQSGVPPGFSTCPRNGTAAMSGIAAMSWKSRIPKAARPVGVASSLRSVIVCTAMAVEESASASPATSAACHGSPSARSARPSAAPHTAS